MVDIDILDLNTMIIGFIAIIILYFVYRNKLNFSRYIPGLICLVLIFVANSIDDYIYFFGDYSDTIESISIIAGSFLLFTAALLELKKEELERT